MFKADVTELGYNTVLSIVILNTHFFPLRLLLPNPTPWLEAFSSNTRHRATTGLAAGSSMTSNFLQRLILAIH